MKLPLVVMTPAWTPLGWIGSGFRDERLGKRFKLVLTQLSEGTADSVPWACQDWASVMAAYRFFDNAQVTDAEIMAGHLRSTRERFASTSAPVLVLHDTTELSYRRDNLGVLHRPK